MIDIYTDGACSGNPGIGGWGVVIINNKKIIKLNDGMINTTNNQMELVAAINALEYFEELQLSPPAHFIILFLTSALLKKLFASCARVLLSSL